LGREEKSVYDERECRPDEGSCEAASEDQVEDGAREPKEELDVRTFTRQLTARLDVGLDVDEVIMLVSAVDTAIEQHKIASPEMHNINERIGDSWDFDTNLDTEYRNISLVWQDVDDPEDELVQIWLEQTEGDKAWK
jgi:hypothetical protein